MATERTLSIIKPNAVHDNHIGAILAKFEAAGLHIVAAKMLRCAKFYIHTKVILLETNI